MDFQAIVRHRQVEELASWVAVAQASAVPELMSLARGVRRDFAAVRAALELPWSTGPVEGQVNRLKLVKRTMYGRAKLDLLRLRVLYA
jgi:transposase